jgi:hypothetical protein
VREIDPTSVQLTLESVFHLFAGLLQTALRLLGSAFGLQVLIVGGVADRLLGLALKFLGLVIGLVVDPARRTCGR